MKRFLWYWLPPLVWMGLIFAFSAQPDLPQAPGPWLDTLVKKVSHALSYGLLAWLYGRALSRSTRTSAAVRVLSAGLAVAYALTDEYHQSFVPGRHGRWLDVAIDGVGACSAMLLDWWMERRRVRPRQASVSQ